MRTILAIPGLVLGIISLFLMFLAMIPLFGWLNWINIPLAVIALIFSLIGRSRGGVILCLVVIVLGMFRLQMGGGIV